MRKSFLFAALFGSVFLFTSTNTAFAQSDTKRPPVLDDVAPSVLDDVAPPVKRDTVRGIERPRSTPQEPLGPSAIERGVDDRGVVQQTQRNFLAEDQYGKVGNYSLVPAQSRGLDPKIVEIINLEAKLSARVHEISTLLRQNPVSPESGELETQLRTTLMEQFDLQQKRRAAEVAVLEGRLKKLNDAIKQRTAAKELIVNRMYELLLTGQDPFAWDGPQYGPARSTAVPTISPDVLNYPVERAVQTTAPAPTLTVPSAAPTPIPALPPIKPSSPSGLTPPVPSDGIRAAKP